MNEMAVFPYIFTFYSFKGGVGRSMALLNTAYTLAGWGKHVLMVDMDLEAPGVSGFLHRHNELVAPEGRNPLDILTLIGEVISAVRAGVQPKDIASNLPPLSSYIRRIGPQKLQSLAPKLGALGRLDIVAADMDRHWCRRFAELGLQGMSQDYLLEISRALHLYFKAYRFTHRSESLGEDQHSDETPYDYILIDSRTGITEIGGLCVGPLSDRLVVLCSLNDQNVEGTWTFLTEAGITPRLRARNAKLWDEADVPAETENRTLGPKPTLVVASPVPNGEMDFKRIRVDEFRKRIGVQPLRLSYHPQMALMETVFVRDYKDEYLAREYLELANAVTRQVSDHPSQHRKRIFRLQEEGKLAEAVRLAIRLAPQDPDMGLSLLLQLGNSFNPASDAEFAVARLQNAILAQAVEFRDVALLRWGNALLAQARAKQGDEADLLFTLAGKKYAEALKVRPNMHEVLNNWGSALLAQARTKQGGDADRLFTLAGVKYAEALRVKPDKTETLFNWGNAISAQANTKKGNDADRLYAAAASKYAEALKIMPNRDDILNNWGVLLSAQAQTKQGVEADRLFDIAVSKYAEALKIMPNRHDALNNWGCLLSQHAARKKGEEADRLYAEATSKYAEALKIKPDQDETLFNWANALSARANAKEGEEADRLYAEAASKYAKSFKIKPDRDDALNNWGNALSARAEAKEGEEADQLYAEAASKYAEALKINPDKHKSLMNWGYALSTQASMKRGAEADALFAEAGAKYADALKIKSDDQETLTSWGDALSARASTKRGAEADALFAEASAKYADALKIKQDDHVTLYNWGTMSLDQARTKHGREAEQLYARAREKLLAAEELNGGIASFNLACLESLLGNEEATIRWLIIRNTVGRRTNRKEIADDADFDRIRNSKAFRAFVEALPEE